MDRLGFNPAFSGPIIKDKLWFYANLETRYESVSCDPDPAGFMGNLPTATTYIGRGSFKLTWQSSPRQQALELHHVQPRVLVRPERR